MPELRDTLVERRLQRTVVAHVGLAREDAAVERLDQPHGLGEVVGRRHRILHRRQLFRDIHRDDVGALLCHSQRVAAPLSSCRARDERDLAIESSHGLVPFFALRSDAAT
jgi:hypothetical protein